MAARRVPLVFRFWHFHIHRASVLFDLAAEVAAEGDRIQERAARVFKCFLQVQSRRTRRDSLPSARLAQALRGRFRPDTKTDLLLVLARAVMTGESVRPLVSKPIEAEGPRAFLRSKSKCGDANSRVFRPSASPGPTSLWHFKGSACEVSWGRGNAPWNDCKECAVFFPAQGRPACALFGRVARAIGQNAITPHWAG